jgi:large subunit ribosomal protein L19
MDTKLVNEVTKEYKKVKHPNFKVGDIIEVHAKIKEEGKERIQVFKGVVIAVKGEGISKTFTVRKISYGVGVEKIFPIYSPVITKIKIIKRATKVRKSKLYFLRKRVGKSALKAGVQIPAHGTDLETQFEEEMREKVEGTGKEEKKREDKGDENKSEEKKEKEQKADGK